MKPSRESDLIGGAQTQCFGVAVTFSPAQHTTGFNIRLPYLSLGLSWVAVSSSELR